MNKLKQEPAYFQRDGRSTLGEIVLFGGTELKTWTMKGNQHPTRAVNIVMAVICALPMSLIFYGHFRDPAVMIDLPIQNYGIFGLCLWLFFWRVALQKNIYKNRLTDVGCQANYWPDIPENIDIFLKWIAGISLFLVVCMIAFKPSAIWLLAGPGGMAVLASKSLIKWKRKIFYTDFKWIDVNWIVIDRKRKLIVFTSHWDPTKTFEEQYVYFQAFVPKDQIEDLIKIAKHHAPTCTHFEQCRWDGCNE